MTTDPQEKTIRAIVVPVTPFQQNCSIVWCLETSKAAVFDPGGDLDNILQAVEENNVSVEKILITHAHLDHAGELMNFLKFSMFQLKALIKMIFS